MSDRVAIYSRDEAKHAAMRLEFNGDPRIRFLVGDVRDVARLTLAMSGISVVIHASAMKRIEACAFNPLECVETNVNGTANVVRACLAAGVRKAVLLNSDKSVRASTTYGLSKAMAERLFIDGNNYSGRNGTRFASCLYGNIAGSTWSVIPTWRKILQESDTVPVSDPSCTRFWMYSDEACDLIFRAINEMRGGEVFIPELPAYRLGDLAEAMGAKMRVIGMAENEKLDEEMRPGESSAMARRMSVLELRDALERT